MNDIHNKSNDKLFEAILNLETIEDCYNFFQDVCTIKEMLDMGQRFEAAILLDKGMNYEYISKELGLSTATISRVSRCLNYGKGGYIKAIKSLKEEGNED